MRQPLFSTRTPHLRQDDAVAGADRLDDALDVVHHAASALRSSCADTPNAPSMTPSTASRSGEKSRCDKVRKLMDLGRRTTTWPPTTRTNAKSPLRFDA